MPASPAKPVSSPRPPKEVSVAQMGVYRPPPNIWRWSAQCADIGCADMCGQGSYTACADDPPERSESLRMKVEEGERRLKCNIRVSQKTTSETTLETTPETSKRVTLTDPIDRCDPTTTLDRALDHQYKCMVVWDSPTSPVVNYWFHPGGQRGAIPTKTLDSLIFVPARFSVEAAFPCNFEGRTDPPTICQGPMQQTSSFDGQSDCHLSINVYIPPPMTWYKFGLTEGNYTHSATANVKVSAVGSSSTILSPSLLDLLNDDDVAPQDIDRETVEQALFNQPDPQTDCSFEDRLDSSLDLADTDRVDNAISSSADTIPSVIGSFTHWAVEDHIRLDSISLEKVISSGKKKDAVLPEGCSIASGRGDGRARE
ncbi:hypothetical protein DFH08DRAFT_1011486 [Mycena albidolilacea]|uniref:Uncharacterized protein n=1 Tax=Mycena albidolilacea TaxID=1033008 RepID=A0AAD7EPA5_9AGAR|nr:hypothetical protein DFH08DRAFT_1011486 [Mycena albidolilacea]